MHTDAMFGRYRTGIFLHKCVDDFIDFVMRDAGDAFTVDGDVQIGIADMAKKQRAMFAPRLLKPVAAFFDKITNVADRQTHVEIDRIKELRELGGRLADSPQGACFSMRLRGRPT